MVTTHAKRGDASLVEYTKLTPTSIVIDGKEIMVLRQGAVATRFESGLAPLKAPLKVSHQSDDPWGF